VVLALGYLYASVSLDTGLSHEESLFRIPLIGTVIAFGMDALSGPWALAVAAAALAIAVARPRSQTTPASIAALLWIEALAITCLTALDLGVLTVAWVAMPVILWRLSRPDTPDNAVWMSELRRTIQVYLLVGAAPLVIATVALGVGHAMNGASAPLDLRSLAVTEIPARWHLPLWTLVGLAALVRMGIFPFHSWIPILLNRAPLGAAGLLVVSQSGLALLLRVEPSVLPNAAMTGAPFLVVLGLLTAIYGAILGLAQRSLRRTLGFVVVSQAGMVLMGVASLTSRSMSGSLLYSLVGVFSITGLLLLVWGVQARVGSCDMARLGGLARFMPRSATFYLLLSVGAVGFPGSLGFVAEDLFVHGAIHSRPIASLVILLTTAVNGITLVRSFLLTYFGKPQPFGVVQPLQDGVPDLLLRERLAVLALLGVVFLGGLFPQLLIDLRWRHVESMVHHAIESDDGNLGAAAEHH
jgi:NADH-quinone oxidoreductase subunit M